MSTDTSTSFLGSKLKDYKELTKFTLSFTVVFTCVICFLLAPDNDYNFKMISILFVAGMLVTGSANAINQAVEKNSDALMKRTATRPVASGRMSQSEAYIFAYTSGAIGVAMMWYFFNAQSALISAISLFIYSFIYTPLKTRNSIAVLIGGFPGALPCLIGWLAGFYDQPISWTGGLVLFAIQFIWQFPHFWAIAWVSHTDYTKAGFKLLPSDKGPTKFTALQALMYSVLMVPIGILPKVYRISRRI
jgi:protoheme IX farnesyltransferase